MTDDFYYVEHGPSKWHAREILMASSDATLPTDVAPGSVAYTADGTYNAMYDGTQWVERTTGGGGGGGGASVTVVNAVQGESAITLDMKAGPMMTAFMAGPVIMHMDTGENMEQNYICSYALKAAEYTFGFNMGDGGNIEMVADTADDYPSISMGP